MKVGQSSDKSETPHSTYFVSSSHANTIYDRFFNKKSENFLNDAKIISILGEWGTGKTTICNMLVEKIKNINDYIIAKYNSLEFEESAQVTSEVYNKVSLSNNMAFFTKYKFRAIAKLKKESILQSMATSQIWSIFIIGIATLACASFVDGIQGYLSNFFGMGFIHVKEPQLLNKSLIYFLVGSLSFILRNKLLVIIAGLLPRRSHVNILESINLGKKQLILFIDEIDRLSPTSIKLLLDEILTMKENLNQNIKIVLFFDNNRVCELLSGLSIKNPEEYLHKLFSHKYKISNYYLYYPIKDIAKQELKDIIEKYGDSYWADYNIIYSYIETINRKVVFYRHIDYLKNHLKIYLPVNNINAYQADHLNYIKTTLQNLNINVDHLIYLIKCLVIIDDYFFNKDLSEMANTALLEKERIDTNYNIDNKEKITSGEALSRKISITSKHCICLLISKAFGVPSMNFELPIRINDNDKSVGDIVDHFYVLIRTIVFEAVELKN